MFNFTPFPILETRSLVLRKMEYGDIADLFEMRRDPRMCEYTDSIPDQSVEETKGYIDKMSKGIEEGKWIIWAMEHRQTKKVIGSISIWNFNHELHSGELGFGIIPDYQGKGLMKEALSRVCHYGFQEMELKVLEAYTEESNEKSIKLLESCNFVPVNRVDEAGYYHNRTFHMIVYAIENNLVG